MYAVRADVPLPVHGGRRVPGRSGRFSSYPFAEMEIGQCFDVPREFSLKARNCAAQWCRSHPGWGYISKTLSDGGARIWRTT